MPKITNPEQMKKTAKFYLKKKSQDSIAPRLHNISNRLTESRSERSE